MLGYDDALDAFGVHGVGGIVGALLTGVFAIEQYGGTGSGLIERQTPTQAAQPDLRQWRDRRSCTAPWSR